MCGELVDGIIHWLGEDRVDILYIKPVDEYDALENDFDQAGWSYHMVAIVDGIVHDPWFPTLCLPPIEYVRCAFPNQRVIATKNPGHHG